MKIWWIEAVIGGYVFLRLILPLKWKWYAKLPAALYVFYAACSLHMGFRLADVGFAGVGFVALFSAFSYAMIFTFFLLLLLADTLRLLLIPPALFFRKDFRAPFRWQANRIHLTLLGLSAALTLIGLIQGTAMPKIRHYSVPVAGLPKAADRTRIVFLSDLHVGHLVGKERIQRLVEITNSLHPQGVLIGGDFVDGPVEKRREDLEPLRLLKSPWGTYGVSGNHEYYSGYRAWKKVLSELNVRMLDNEHVTIPGICTIAGVTYEYSDPDLALQERDESLPILFIRHDPRYAEAAAKRGIALQLSGHTHGGMILGLDRLIAAMNGGFVRGLYSVGGMTLIVNSGTNIWAGFPIRIGVPAEISVITLRALPAR